MISAPIHNFVFSWAMIFAPALPTVSFKPVCSKRQCVLNRPCMPVAGEGKEHIKHKRHKKKEGISCAFCVPACASCAPSPFGLTEPLPNPHRQVHQESNVHQQKQHDGEPPGGLFGGVNICLIPIE